MQRPRFALSAARGFFVLQEKRNGTGMNADFADIRGLDFEQEGTETTETKKEARRRSSLLCFLCLLLLKTQPWLRTRPEFLNRSLNPACGADDGRNFPLKE